MRSLWRHVKAIRALTQSNQVKPPRTAITVESDVKLDLDFIVHIGTGKTGSSSIQKTLAGAKPQLDPRQVAYIGLMGEVGPVQKYQWQRSGGWPSLLALGRQQARAELANLLTEKLESLAKSGIKTVIWSNESLFGSDQIVLPLLEGLSQRGARIKVIVYIRRHDAWAQSAYLQWGVKHKTTKGPVKSFREWITVRKVAFHKELLPWIESSWLQLFVRNFDACGDVVTDFLTCVDLHDAGIVVRRENETPNAVALALWAIYNSQNDEPVLPVQLQGTLKRGGLLGGAPREANLADLVPQSDDIEKLRASCEADRAALNEVFRSCGQPDMATDPIRVKSMEVSQGQINAALLLLIKRQDDQIQWLRNQLFKLHPELTDKGSE